MTSRQSNLYIRFQARNSLCSKLEIKQSVNKLSQETEKKETLDKNKFLQK